jgi:hypothetical protein
MPMLYVIIKSFLWILIGTIFGFSAFFLIFASKILYGQKIDIHQLLNYEFIVYLCVALMAGAAADWANLPDRHWGSRICPMMFCVILLFLLYTVFNPAAPHPKEAILKYITTFYVTVCVVFCMLIKANIFYEECEHIKPAKF